MAQAKYEYQSDFARKYFAEGRAEGRAAGEAEGRAAGEAHGRAALLLKLLQLKFGPLSESMNARVQSASIAELDAWAERVLSATTIDDVVR